MLTHLEPLAISANITQADDTRLDHILLSLGNLYRIYDGMGEEDAAVKQGIHASLEKRWANADQDPFILAVFFNPYIRADLFNRRIIQFTPAGIYGIIRRVYKRIFRVGDDALDYELHSACMDYYNSREEFSDEAMSINHLEAAAKAKVHYNISLDDL